jgi:RNA polymerase sigma factor (sigma-70 family)
MVPLDEAAELPGLDAESLILLDQALEKLEALNERQARVVECRCFVGLSVEETAAALNTSPTTVKRDWAFARAWLNQQFGEGEGFWKA